jgi:NADP-dependent 3-hydroxy acid dehydrogenase YdfG
VARTAPALHEAAAAIGGGAAAFPCDVTDPDAVAALAAAVAGRWTAGPDILVNNAGVFELALVHQTDPAAFGRALDTNLMAPFLLTRAFLPGMLARGSGHVVTIGSVADRSVFPENGAYAARTYGARALHEVLRAETRGSGVRASLVSPSAVDTPLWDAVDPDARPGFTPRAAMLAAAAVADAVLWVTTRPPETNVDELRLGRA